jgi:hypothetical protein
LVLNFKVFRSLKKALCLKYGYDHINFGIADKVVVDFSQADRGSSQGFKKFSIFGVFNIKWDKNISFIKYGFNNG